MSITVWVWFAAAVVLLVAEILSPGGLYLLPFAIGSFGAAVASALHASAAWQWIVFVSVTSVLTVVFQRLVAPRRRR